MPQSPAALLWQGNQQQQSFFNGLFLGFSAQSRNLEGGTKTHLISMNTPECYPCCFESILFYSCGWAWGFVMHYIASLCLNSPNLTSPRDSRCPVEPAVVGRAEQFRIPRNPSVTDISVLALIALANLRSPKKLAEEKYKKHCFFPNNHLIHLRFLTVSSRRNSFFLSFLKLKVPTKYSYGMLFCSCPAGDQLACAERRRQTIVPICSYEDKDKPNCLSLQNACKTNYICRCDGPGPPSCLGYCADLFGSFTQNKKTPVMESPSWK